jgi:uncharacterized membrane protein SpoIIM required for sporulation
MEFVDALQSILDGYRSRPAELLSVYFLSPAVTQVTRVVTYAGLAVAYAYLAVTGRLSRFRSELRTAGPDPPGPNADFETIQRWFEAVGPAFERLVPPEVLGILAVAVVLTVALFAVLYAVSTAAQLSCCRAILHDERGTVAAIAGARRHWTTLLGLLVTEVVVVLLVTAVAVAPVVALAASPAAALLVGLLVGLVWLLAVVALRVFFAFAAVAVVVDGVGVRGGLGGSRRFVRSNPLWVLGYVFAVVGVLALVGSAAATGGTNSGAVSALLGFVVVSPLLDLLKTALYGDHAGGIAPPETPESSVFDQLRGGVRRGVDAMTSFVRSRPGLHAVAALLLVGGGLGGWALAGPYEGLVNASIEARLENYSPATATVAFAANNTAVAVSSAMSGLALGVPSAVALLFNGAVIGGLARLEVAPLALLAFVVPHGVVEIPALVVAGALGLSLGGTGWRALGGRTTRERLAERLEEAFWILVGVAVLLAVAGIIEGVFSPYYFRPFVG